MSNLPSTRRNVQLSKEHTARTLARRNGAVALVSTVALWSIVMMYGPGLGLGLSSAVPSVGTDTAASAAAGAPNTPIADAIVVSDTSSYFTTSAFVGSGGDTQDTTIFHVDTIDGDWTTPRFADTVTTGDFTLSDTVFSLDSAGVFKARALVSGANGGRSLWSDSVQFTSTGGEPRFVAATDTMMLSDSLDQWASITEMFDSMNATGPSFNMGHGLWMKCDSLADAAPCGDTVADFSDANGFFQIITGADARGGSGSAFRIAYADETEAAGTSQGSQDPRQIWSYPNPQDTSDAARMTNFLTVWIRITAVTAADTVWSQSWQNKFVLFWHGTSAADRIQMQHRNIPNPPCSARPVNRGTQWGWQDNGVDGDCVAANPDSLGQNPLDLLITNAWTRFTFQYQAPTASPGYDGTFKMWVDGVLVSDTSPESLGVTPAGANVWKSWSDSTEQEAFQANAGVGYIAFGGNRTSGDFRFYMDVDDFQWWIRPGG